MMNSSNREITPTLMGKRSTARRTANQIKFQTVPQQNVAMVLTASALIIGGLAPDTAVCPNGWDNYSLQSEIKPPLYLKDIKKKARDKRARFANITGCLLATPILCL
jgi:hypothetical protein